MRLANKVAIVTGGAGNIGPTIAEVFAREGAKVVVADVRREAGERVVTAIEGIGGTATFVMTMGIGVHEIDLLRWLLGQEVVEVTAMTDGPNDQYPVEYLTAATLRFSTGALGQFVSSRRLPNGTNSVSVYGAARRVDG